MEAMIEDPRARARRQRERRSEERRNTYLSLLKIERREKRERRAGDRRTIADRRDIG